MSGDLRPVADRTIDAAGGPEPSGRGRAAAVPPLSDDTRLAVVIRGLVERGEMDEARERFTDLVTQHQRRAASAFRSSSIPAAFIPCMKRE